MSDAGLEALLDGVWRRRRSELLARVDALAAGLRSARTGDRAAWQDVGVQAHRLTGALGSLGFTELGRAAARLEAAVAAHPAPGPELLDALAAQVQRLQEALVSAHERPRG